MSVSDTIDVSITVQDSVPKAESFGEPLILAYHTNFVGVREYDADASGLSALVTDGFAVSHDVYRKAAAICAQNPHAAKFKVANRTVPNAQEIKLTPQWATVGKPVSCDIDVGGTVTSVSYTPVTDDTETDVATALLALIDALAGLQLYQDSDDLYLHPVDLETRIYLKNVVGLDILDVSVDALGAQALQITPDAPDTTTYTCTVQVGDESEVVTYTSGGEDDQEAIAIELASQFDAIDGCTGTAVAGEGDTDYVLVTADDPAAPVFLSGVTASLTVVDASPTAGIAADLALTIADDSEWYGLLIDSQNAAEILAAAAWCASNEKMLGAQSADTLIGTADGGVAADLQALTNHLVYVFFTRDMCGQGAAALMGRQFSRTPGSTTWAHKVLTGAIADALSATEFSYARANGAITYVNDQGLSHTYDGFACSGRFLDITRGIAWLRSRIREACLIVMINAEKVSFTDIGAGRFEAAVRGVLSQAVSNKLLADGPDVTRPAVADVSTADKAARTLPDLKFSGVLAGAIHKTKIDGSVTV